MMVLYRGSNLSHSSCSRIANLLLIWVEMEAFFYKKKFSNWCGWSSDENLMGQMRISKEQHKSDTICASTGRAQADMKKI
jgi:hypothetical protein